MSVCFADVTCAAITWDIIRTLLHMLGFSNQSSFHRCPRECMFSFKNGPDTETVSSAFEFLRGILNICDNDNALVYLI